MRIDVKAEHIANGEPANSKRCMIALAFADAIGAEVGEVGCCGFAVSDYRPGGLWLGAGNLPDDVTQKVSDFDSGRKVEPFSFELDIPSN